MKIKVLVDFDAKKLEEAVKNFRQNNKVNYTLYDACETDDGKTAYSVLIGYKE